MFLYTYYNTDLIDIARAKQELSTGFVDDCTFVATVDTLVKTHIILRDMMERSGGGLKWSQHHNSPFEISKLVVMDFPGTHQDITPPPLCITKTNLDGSTSSFIITKVNTYKYLGVVFNTKLSWHAHTDKVITKATKWSQQLWRLAKITGGIPPIRACQLYNTVLILAITYTSDIWYVPPFKLSHSRNSCGSIAITRKLRSIQG